MASQIIESLSTDWDPKRYHDSCTEELKSLIDAKAKGKEIVVEEDAPAENNIFDLMAALEASLGAARQGSGSGAATKKTPVKKAIAKKSGAKKSAGQEVR